MAGKVQKTATHKITVSTQLPKQPPPYRSQHFRDKATLQDAITAAISNLEKIQAFEDDLKQLLEKSITRNQEYTSYLRFLRDQQPRMGLSTDDLPEDVLLNIFHFCLIDQTKATMHPTHQDPMIRNIGASTCTLQLVCKQWAHLVQNACALWSTLPSININDKSPTEKEISAIGAHLSRSLRSRLNVELHGGSFVDNTTLNSLICVLGPHMTRVEKLTLCVNSFFLYSVDHGEGAQGPLPRQQVGFFSLKSLALTLPGEFVHTVELLQHFPDIVLWEAPLLENLTLQFTTHPHSIKISHLLKFPWKQLTCLRIYTMPPRSLYHILRMAERVEQFKMVDPRMPSQDHYELYPMSGAAFDWEPDHLDGLLGFARHSLRLLHIHSSVSEDSSWINKLLDLLRLPNLQDFQIHGMITESEVMKNFLERSACTLINFSLESDESFGGILEHCPAVETLGIGYAGPDLLRQLSEVYENGWHVPRLRTLFVHSPLLSEPSSLEDLLRSRQANQPNVSRIIRVEVTSNAHDTLHSSGELLFLPGAYITLKDIYSFENGYSLINDPNGITINDLEACCDELEVFKYRPIESDRVFKSYKWLPPLVKLCEMLKEAYPDDAEEPTLDEIDRRIISCRARLYKICRAWTHDPWAFGELQAGWGRDEMIEVCQGHDNFGTQPYNITRKKIVYVASS